MCRRHYRLVHEGGFGVERIADGALCFTRPDGLVITEHPRLTDARDIEGFRRQSIDAADWIIPAGVLDLDLAVSGIMRAEESGREVTPFI
ncbi:MAG: hypothetical protein GY785_25205 [Gammaproteobacteria bacterium]|nr:hypothetical protein [Gammaproteobacteria bacterium]